MRMFSLPSPSIGIVIPLGRMVLGMVGTTSFVQFSTNPACMSPRIAHKSSSVDVRWWSTGWEDDSRTLRTILHSRSVYICLTSRKELKINQFKCETDRAVKGGLPPSSRAKRRLSRMVHDADCALFVCQPGTCSLQSVINLWSGTRLHSQQRGLDEIHWRNFVI